MQIFLIFNSIALPVLTRPELDIKAKTIISIVGLALSMVWFLVTIRAEQWIHFWNGAMRRLELLDFDRRRQDTDAPRVAVFSSLGFRTLSEEWVTVHRILLGVTFVAMAVWLWLLLYFSFEPR